ncbi:ELM1/GtrOC1 family putative glycosyltransferase [Methyloligella solikamskensis]|uniref:ELM1/GtrOC1 family putative glycosyltransferase n=1 Tax=Methyloligella solikamskensis TaxID=1177756 RepID=A0ABW3JBT7_9HYPH
MPPLKVLFLADTRPGHYHLSEGVIAALKRLRDVQVTRIEIRRKWIVPTRWLRARIHAKSFFPPRMLRMAYRIEAEELPQADLVISAGGETLMPNICVSRYLDRPSIFCGSLRDLDAKEFSLVISSYERDADAPRHMVTLKPSPMDPDSLGRSDEVIQFGPDRTPKLAALLIGGNAASFRFGRGEWKDLIARIGEISQRWGTRWMISTSRRTPDYVADMLADFAKDERAVERFVDFRTAGPSTLPDIFSRAEIVLCTADSSSMVSEAISARLPVVGLTPKASHLPEDESAYRDLLVHRNWYRVLPIAELTPERLASNLAEITPIEENPLDALAAKLKERLPELLSG